jgi:hypothetical protein
VRHLHLMIAFRLLLASDGGDMNDGENNNNNRDGSNEEGENNNNTSLTLLHLHPPV